MVPEYFLVPVQIRYGGNQKSSVASVESASLAKMPAVKEKRPALTGLAVARCRAASRFVSFFVVELVGEISKLRAMLFGATRFHEPFSLLVSGAKVGRTLAERHT